MRSPRFIAQRQMWRKDFTNHDLMVGIEVIISYVITILRFSHDCVCKKRFYELKQKQLFPVSIGKLFSFELEAVK